MFDLFLGRIFCVSVRGFGCVAVSEERIFPMGSNILVSRLCLVFVNGYSICEILKICRTVSGS